MMIIIIIIIIINIGLNKIKTYNATYYGNMRVKICMHGYHYLVNRDYYLDKLL